MIDKVLEKLEAFLTTVGEEGLEVADIDYLYKVVDIYKDMKEVECMNNYGRYDAYGEYNNYGNSYGRRGVDSRYRGEDYMESMRGSYRNYEDARNEYNRGNYGAKEDGLKELEYTMHAAMKFIKMVKEEATSPEEQEIVRKHIMKISDM